MSKRQLNTNRTLYGNRYFDLLVGRLNEWLRHANVPLLKPPFVWRWLPGDRKVRRRTTKWEWALTAFLWIILGGVSLFSAIYLLTLGGLKNIIYSILIFIFSGLLIGLFIISARLQLKDEEISQAYQTRIRAINVRRAVNERKEKRKRRPKYYH